MPRKPRVNRGPGFFHITCRGDRREPVYLDVGDYMRFLEILGDVVETHRWRCHAYCLMPNHYHLLVELEDTSLSDGMRRLNTLYAQRFNRKYGYVGHVFQERFHSGHVDGAYYAFEAARYIVFNPERAGLCAWHDWPWSSYRATCGEAAAPRFLTTEWLIELFGETPESGRAAYAAYVRAARTATRTRAAA